MSEVDRIQDQLTRAFEGEAWHGPSVREVLEGVDARMASSRPLAEAHSIWELVLHITTWEAVVASRLRGQPLQVTPELDWPKITETSESAWALCLAALESGHAALVRDVMSVDAARLDEPIGPNKPSLYVLLHGIVQHDLYHAGQIALLKKAVTPGPR
jgi:uncharacterized damage-inducible protein DinB